MSTRIFVEIITYAELADDLRRWQAEAPEPLANPWPAKTGSLLASGSQPSSVGRQVRAVPDKIRVAEHLPARGR